MLGFALARTEELVIQKTDNEHLIYDLQSNKAICLNQTSALVWEHCDGKHSVSDISKVMETKLGLEVSEDLVLLAISQLANEGLLSGSEELPERFRGLTRREVIRKVGLASMVALPIVSAIVAPVAAQVQSCVGSGTLAPSTLVPCPITIFGVPSNIDCIAYCEDPSTFTACCSGTGTADVTFVTPGNTCDCSNSSCT